MAFSYSNTLATNLDRVRFLLGDTVEATAKFQDEEITGLLSLGNDPVAAAVTCCYARASKLAEQVDVTMGRTRESTSQAAKAWMDLAKRLQESGGSMLPGYGGEVAGWVGGASKAEVEALESNTDRIQDMFGVGMHDYPGGTGVVDEDA